MAFEKFAPNEGPRGFGGSLSKWQGRGDSKRPSLEKTLADAGVSLKRLAEVARTHPEVVDVIRGQLGHLIDSGATREEVVDFFRKQEEGSRIIADLTDSSPEWKKDLNDLRSRIPKVN